MKNLKKVLIVALTVSFLFLGTMGTVLAKNVNEGTKTTTVTFSFSSYTALNVNSVSYSGIVTGAKIKSISFSAKGVEGVQTEKYNTKAFMTSPNGPVSGSIVVTLTLDGSANVGDTGTVTLTGGYGDKNGSYHEKSWSQSVQVVEKTTTTGGTTVKLDLTELKKQISIAEGLNEKEYTSTSWKVLADELSDGKAALKATTQAKVDAAAKELADAIAQLVKMDWSKLQDAINQGNALIESEEMGDLWRDFLNAMNNGSLLLGSNDQDAVNAAADEVLAALEALKAYLGLDDDAVIVKPGEEFCNISIHKVWPILFFISLALNAVLGVLLVKGKKNKLNDNTPVVNYDISDDDK